MSAGPSPPTSDSAQGRPTSTSIAVKSLSPADDSTQVTAWATPPQDTGERALRAEAYQHALNSHADPCGLVMLANRAAAASVIGMLAACLAIAEPLRYLHGSETSISLAYDTARPRAPRQARRADVSAYYLMCRSGSPASGCSRPTVPVRQSFSSLPQRQIVPRLLRICRSVVRGRGWARSVRRSRIGDYETPSWRRGKRTYARRMGHDPVSKPGTPGDQRMPAQIRPSEDH